MLEMRMYMKVMRFVLYVYISVVSFVISSILFTSFIVASLIGRRFTDGKRKT